MAKRVTEDRDHIKQAIITKASVDPTFRQQLISNPRQTLREELGASLPADVQISVLEETPSRYYLVLPPTGVRAGTELSDAELGAMAGGDVDTWSNFPCMGS